MKNKLFKVICFFTVVSCVFLIISISHYQSVKTTAQESAESYKASKVNLSNIQKSESNNRILINRVKNDPSKLGKEAKATTIKVIDIMKSEEEKADIDKEKIYKDKLSSCVDEKVLNNPDLTSLEIPKNYKISTSTSRGHNIPVLIIGESSRYIKLNYDTSNRKIESITEYKVSE